MVGMWSSSPAHLDVSQTLWRAYREQSTLLSALGGQRCCREAGPNCRGTLLPCVCSCSTLFPAHGAMPGCRDVGTEDSWGVSVPP